MALPDKGFTSALSVESVKALVHYKRHLTCDEALDWHYDSKSLFGRGLYLRIAGLYYNASQSRSECGVFEGYVTPEPGNPHDPNALKVCRSDGRKMGYVPAVDTRLVRLATGILPDDKWPCLLLISYVDDQGATSLEGRCAITWNLDRKVIADEREKERREDAEALARWQRDKERTELHAALLALDDDRMLDDDFDPEVDRMLHLEPNDHYLDDIDRLLDRDDLDDLDYDLDGYLDDEEDDERDDAAYDPLAMRTEHDRTVDNSRMSPASSDQETFEKMIESDEYFDFRW